MVQITVKSLALTRTQLTFKMESPYFRMRKNDPSITIPALTLSPQDISIIFGGLAFKVLTLQLEYVALF